MNYLAREDINSDTAWRRIQALPLTHVKCVVQTLYCDKSIGSMCK